MVLRFVRIDRKKKKKKHRRQNDRTSNLCRDKNKKCGPSVFGRRFTNQLRAPCSSTFRCPVIGPLMKYLMSRVARIVYQSKIAKAVARYKFRGGVEVKKLWCFKSAYNSGEGLYPQNPPRIRP